MYLLKRIEQFVYTNNDARAAIGRFVLQQKDQIEKLSIGQIAEKCYTSKATIVRFAKVLGYDGWSDFKKDFLRSLRIEKENQNPYDVNYPFSKNDSILQISEAIEQVEIQAIKETKANISEKTIKEAALRIIKAREVVIFGISPNRYYGEIFKRKLNTIGIKARTAEDSETGLSACLISSADCALLISCSGNMPDVQPMVNIPILKENNVPLIGITGCGNC